VLGRADKLDMANAALVNGITSHTFDFDDTHLKTIIHPAGPVASAVLALAEHTGNTGREVIDALVIGIDVACRVGNAMYPDHYDRGWHITGSTGTLGAAAACARLLKLDVAQTAMALGIAASQPIGMREQFGTMTKPFHPGGAARAGLMSALLAKHGFTSSAKALEAPRGMMQTVSTKNDWSEITGELGERFEISFNSYKPFACGIVIHPSIDACAQLRAQGVTPEQIERIELKVHSLVLEKRAARRLASQIQRLPRLRGRSHRGPGHRRRVPRCFRDPPRQCGIAPQSGCRGRRFNRRSQCRCDSDFDRWPPRPCVCRTRHWLAAKPDDDELVRRQVSWFERPYFG
jgi:2-methylcitrate dehydratase PrpD